MFDIKIELEALSALLLSKGCASPDLSLTIRAHIDYRGEINYYPDKNYTNYQTQYFHEYSLEETVKRMRQYVYAIPSLEERQHQEHLKKLAATIEYGRKIGIDDQFINPLELQMKKLSGNIIEHKRSEAPDESHF